MDSGYRNDKRRPTSDITTSRTLTVARRTRLYSLDTARDSATIAASKYPKDCKNVSVKHRGKLELLKKVWRDGEHGKLFEFTIINNNGVCFHEKFLIGSGSYGTEVYVCLGSDGIERAIKRLPKVLCKLLKNERNILTSPNAVGVATSCKLLLLR
jgi:hypothetical protein